MIKIYTKVLLIGLLWMIFSQNAYAQCEAGDLQTTTPDTLSLDETFDVMAINEVVPAQGGYGWLFDNTNTDGTGGLGGTFIFPGLTTSETLDSDLAGALSAIGFPLLEGTWVVRGAAYSDMDMAFETICSTTADSLVITFDNAIGNDMCFAGDLQTVDTVFVADGETFDLLVINEIIPAEGSYSWTFDNTNTDGTGSIGTLFNLFTPNTSSTFDNDLNGVLSSNILPVLEGTWIVRGEVFSDAQGINSCSITADSLVVIFGEASDECISGDLLTVGAVSLCGSETVDVEVANSNSPGAGGFGYLMQNSVTGGTGALDGDFVLFGVGEMLTVDAGLGGLLAQNQLNNFEGSWVLKAVSFNDIMNPLNSICSTSQDSLIITFSPELSLTLDNNGNTEIVSDLRGGVAPFTYSWSNGETTPNATDLSDGVLILSVTDAAGCFIDASIVLDNTSVEDIAGLESFTFGPNPTTGFATLDFKLDTEQNMIISIQSLDGRIIETITNQRTKGGVFDINMSDYNSGMYLLHISTNEGQYATRIMKQ